MNETLVVTDQWDLLVDLPDVKALSFEQYLAQYPKKNETKTRVINLCDTERYLSQGYYCSLLAVARKHAVMPTVRTINAMRESKNNSKLILPVSKKYAVDKLDAAILEKPQLLFFGQTERPELVPIAKYVFQRYPSPILQLKVSFDAKSITVEVERLSIERLDDSGKTRLQAALVDYIGSHWPRLPASRQMRWDMAILVNPEDELPPSDDDAINRFIKAAAKHGIRAQLITASQAHQIANFDALFIRETTAIDHHTYRIAAKAEQEGLVVIDDPSSILRCCNKVFLHDAFDYNGVPAPKTRIVASSDEEQLDALEQEFDYPIVLKMPEGSFSSGVFKVADRKALRKKLDELLKESALALVQEYLYTEFDWRIGVLNGRAIYACKYLMARDHWQIYNHNAKKRYMSGGFETLPTFEVPKAVLAAAVKASNMIGKGLYGVDIKQQGRHVYVIEVNDNPSIDHEVEDAYLGNELYMQIMAEFCRRLELRGR
jgi:glutathione synthase/RimK-type ligase-like ATP-grasp enzyme